MDPVSNYVFQATNMVFVYGEMTPPDVLQIYFIWWGWGVVTGVIVYGFQRVWAFVRSTVGDRST